MRRTISALSMALVCAAGQPANHKAAPPPPLSKQLPPEQRSALWRQDLQFFAQHFSNGHCSLGDWFRSPLLVLEPCHQADFGKLYAPAEFSKEVQTIEEAVPTLTDPQIVLRLARLVAKGHVGHTSVNVPALRLGFSIMPFAFRWYADGLAITAATPQYSDALGARVLRFGSMSAEDALKAVAPYISYENENWLRSQSAGYFVRMQVLQEIGAAERDGNVKLTLQKAGGEAYDTTVRARDPRVKQVDIYTALKTPQTLARKHPDNQFYWYEYLPESRALYIQYNQCESDPKHPFGQFTSELFAFADSHKVDRAIVDLRLNSGGNSMVIHSLKSGLGSRHYPVFVLIGDGTFSSAQDNAIDMRRQINATLVGDPTGEKPNGYGEVRQLHLPNSGLNIQYSTQFYRIIKNSDADALYPDITVHTTIGDVLAGRDPVLEAALQAAPRTSGKK